MITVKTERPYTNGLVRRRYEVTATDLLGNTHTEILGMFNHLPENDGSEVETQWIEGKKNAEVEQYKEVVRNGDNPFTADGLWNTRDTLLKAVLDDALSLPATDDLVINGLPYMALVTDAELMALYGKDQLWVDDVRAKASTLLGAKSTLDAYVGVL